MQKQNRPIIKRVKKSGGHAHHGGAWKVAYADFVTAMMAFFLLMWLLNATTEKQRKGLADFFNPTIPINRVSGGGTDMFGGDSVFSEDRMAQSGAGASQIVPTEAQRARGEVGRGDMGMEDEKKALDDLLQARGGESMTMERALRHVVTRVTDEGLVIEVFDLPDTALFEGDTAVPRAVLRDVARVLADVLALTTNRVAVAGHVRNYPLTLIDNPVWPLSADRAQTMRRLLGDMGLEAARITRVAGHADRRPVTQNPMAIRNNRVEVILLRRDR
ncbi:flagellar motor protein MotB [Falsirhodobacter halotolerans]|uniref:flagellar motor protein MotB n=1 Tax=Falsirhodobacter halotolerans TaxID=1146892 RepID=UPI001FD4788A|nr:flagellar motor protein MotB [Falsirhodobacter halotolerans]MCJ8140736.1 chemotaxis protein MotB [Falsirhodobacter halotolerans]